MCRITEHRVSGQGFEVWVLTLEEPLPGAVPSGLKMDLKKLKMAVTDSTRKE